MNVLIKETSIQDIGNAIREKNGTENTYKPSEMGNAIREIQSGDKVMGYTVYRTDNFINAIERKYL
jgi:hypothetical protein